MPRPLRLHVPGALYHVTLRGNHRQNIFHTTHHRQILADLIAEVITRFDARLHTYCFMTNHQRAFRQPLMRFSRFPGPAPLGGTAGHGPQPVSAG